ncbi:hypothetical protein Salat_1005600 [Sesamum alatum]|uniref:Uncharacterized protein n=1 Tax=Sesamum alatum TaxID=300844 RepID=A0AAE1YL71_9LAMI|nr:hypothetical protein Salat_1005600 [Sesamum alatum]
MRASSTPISSPCKAEQLPPPLMKFLKRRSRGRARSTPMFYRRNASAVTEPTDQDPSSPEVTCTGQVKASRSAEPNAKKPGRASTNRHPCWFLKKALLCGKSSLTFSCCRKRSSFCKWGLFLRFGCFKKDNTTKDSSGACRKQTSAKTENPSGGNDRRNSSSSVDESSFPPKSALILTRCKSVPHRSSSLRGRFWGLIKLKIRQNQGKCRSPAMKMRWKSQERAKKVVKN